GAYRGDDSAPPWTWRRARQNMVWIYAVGLIFLLFSFGTVAAGNPTALDWIVRIGTLALIALGYLCVPWVCDLALWQRWAYIAAFVALLVSSYHFMGIAFIYYGIFVAIMAATLIPWRQARVTILVVGVSIMVAALISREYGAISIGLTGIFVGWATGAGIESGRIARKLNHSQQRVSVLAVAAERERIGRDLHDILGHSLTAISIKAGLAGRLVDQDPAAAKAEIFDIEQIARQALADVRATASGYQEVRVVSELASARSVLLAAGIDARVPTAVETLAPETNELFGYVIREAVTNVVRHSEARTCTITVSPEAVTVIDDGRGFSPNKAGCGSGLVGLARRMADAGGRLEVDSPREGGTRVRAEALSPATAPTAQLTPIGQT
ncbi:MAG: sensor histidine kinase, partial [Propionibacteriaceae bacterium]